MLHDSNAVFITEDAALVEALREHLHGTPNDALHCPRAAPSAWVYQLYL